VQASEDDLLEQGSGRHLAVERPHSGVCTEGTGLDGTLHQLAGVHRVAGAGGGEQLVRPSVEHAPEGLLDHGDDVLVGQWGDVGDHVGLMAQAATAGRSLPSAQRAEQPHMTGEQQLLLSVAGVVEHVRSSTKPVARASGHQHRVARQHRRVVGSHR
jgi:hypothetical protein